MKTITFESKQYEVPDWVTKVARDADGQINGFEISPLIDDDKEYDFFLAQKGSRWVHIDDIGYWKDSLTEV